MATARYDYSKLSVNNGGSVSTPTAVKVNNGGTESNLYRLQCDGVDYIHKYVTYTCGGVSIKIYIFPKEGSKSETSCGETTTSYDYRSRYVTCLDVQQTSQADSYLASAKVVGTITTQFKRGSSWVNLHPTSSNMNTTQTWSSYTGTSKRFNFSHSTGWSAYGSKATAMRIVPSLTVTLTFANGRTTTVSITSTTQSSTVNAPNGLLIKSQTAPTNSYETQEY